jgi:hypothetical protein
LYAVAARNPQLVAARAHSEPTLPRGRHASDRSWDGREPRSDS